MGKRRGDAAAAVGGGRVAAVEVEESCEKENKESKRMARGDVVRVIVGRARHKDRGSQGDNRIGTLHPAAGSPLIAGVEDDRGVTRRGLGDSSAGHKHSSLDMASIRHCNDHAGPRRPASQRK